MMNIINIIYKNYINKLKLLINMYHRKTPKSQEAYKSIYTVYNPHTMDLNQRISNNKVRVISVDPGITNFCIRVEERGIKDYIPIKTLLFDKMHLRKEEVELTDNLICQYYTTLNNYLDSNLDLFKTCDMVIVEKQLPINYKAVRISQHVITYFMVHLKNISSLPIIFEVDPKLKGRELGASSHLNSKGLKAWAVEEATRILQIRNDEYGLEVLRKNKRKADDLADTVCQIEAFFSYKDWPLSKDTRLKLNFISSKPLQQIKQPIKLNLIG